MQNLQIDEIDTKIELKQIDSFQPLNFDQIDEIDLTPKSLKFVNSIKSFTFSTKSQLRQTTKDTYVSDCGIKISVDDCFCDKESVLVNNFYGLLTETFTQNIIDKLDVRFILTRDIPGPKTGCKRHGKNHRNTNGLYCPDENAVYIKINDEKSARDIHDTLIHELIHVIDYKGTFVHKGFLTDPDWSVLTNDRDYWNFASQYAMINDFEDKAETGRRIIIGIDYDSLFYKVHYVWKKTDIYNQKVALMTERLLDFHPDFQAILDRASSVESLWFWMNLEEPQINLFGDRIK